MSGDVLSQAEVESLLSAMDSRESDVDRRRAPRSRIRHREKVSPYDFKRPERVGKEQMRVAANDARRLRPQFRRPLSRPCCGRIVEVKLTSVDQLTYSEFVFSLENPTCFNLINAEPLEGQLDPRHQPVDPVSDHRPAAWAAAARRARSSRRPLTEIELRLVSRITDLFCNELKHAWENVLELDLSIDRVESNPQLVQIVPPNEVVVLISFELTIGDVRGMMNLCIPFNAIERISAQAVSQQLGQLRQEDGHAGKHSSGSAAS